MQINQNTNTNLFSSFFFLVEDGAWCICRSDQNTSALQSALDYACGSGADCSAIQQTGGCYSPNTVVAHCSYAANSYYQRKDQTQGACDFSGTATLTSTDPSNTLSVYLPIHVSISSSISIYQLQKEIYLQISIYLCLYLSIIHLLYISHQWSPKLTKEN